MTNAYNRTTGRSDAAQAPIMGVVRAPVFVDNAVIHAEVTKTAKGDKVVPPTRGDFEISHDRTYKLVEEEDGVRVLHNSSYDGAVFYHNRKLTAGEAVPTMIYAAERPVNRLVASDIETATTGSRLTLQNLKSKALKDIGFAENRVRFGHGADVGLRTSDLALKLVDAATGSVNSAFVPRKRHTNTYVSYDFHDAEVISALRYLSKHDGQGIRSDRFGNVLYTHQNRVAAQHYIGDSAVTGGSQSDNISHAPNRVTVYGKARANNSDNVVRIDDVGARTDGVINEMVGGIHVPTVSTEGAARRIGQRILASARRATSSKRLMGVLSATRVRPGDRIQRVSDSSLDEGVVLEAQHDLSRKTSEIHISAIPTSIEDILQKFQEDNINQNERAAVRNEQKKTQSITTGTSVEISAHWNVSTKYLRPSGMVIGHRERGLIHGNGTKPDATTKIDHAIGMNKGKRIVKRRG